MTRDELVECAALVRGCGPGISSRSRRPRHPLDVLAQQIVAEAACRPLGEDELFALVRRAWPYRDLPREEFDAVVAMLSEGIATRRGRAGALLHRDGVNHVVRGRRGARLAALTAGGAIPDNADYDVVAEPEGPVVGKVDEDFAVESMAGDIFLLGNTSWRIRRVERAWCASRTPAGAAPTVPFWLGEAPARSAELSAEVSRLRARSRAAARAPATRPSAGSPPTGALARGRGPAGGRLPRRRRGTRSRRRADPGHARRRALLRRGRRHAARPPRAVRRAHQPRFGLALRKRFCRTFDFELQAAATDDGVLLSLGPQHSFPLDADLRAALLRRASTRCSRRRRCSRRCSRPAGAGTRPARWRCCASAAAGRCRRRSSACGPTTCSPRSSPRGRAARTTPTPPGRSSCPTTRSSTRPCATACTRRWTPTGSRRCCGAIEAGEIRSVARDLAEPSPLAHEILNAKPYAFLDDAPLEERRARAVSLRRAAAGGRGGGLGRARRRGDRARWRRRRGPRCATPTSCTTCCSTLGLLPAAEGAPWRALPRRAPRAPGAPRGRGSPGGAAWVAAERVGAWRALSAEPASTPRRSTRRSPARSAGRTGVARRGAARGAARLAARLGPVTAPALAARLGLPRPRVAAALAGSRRRAACCAAASCRRRPAASSGASAACWRASTG